MTRFEITSSNILASTSILIIALKGYEDDIFKFMKNKVVVMKEKHRCIYCNTSNDLSKSDIIADALTNARIYNNNVCRIAHNNKFSDLFESEVIEKLAFITNSLDIKSSKGKNYQKYDARLTIDGIDYKTTLSSQAELFMNGKVLTSANGKSKLAEMALIEKMAHGNKDAIETVDINKQIIEQKVKIDIAVYFSTAMFRMISKVAYEWYCAENDISGKHEEFDNIIKFITEGTGDNPVSVITDEEVYNTLRDHSLLGSHILLSYNADDGENVIVSLFGIAIYRVLIADMVPSFCHVNCSYLELTTNGEKKNAGGYESIQDAESKAFCCAFDETGTHAEYFGGLKAVIADSYSKERNNALLWITYILPFTANIARSTSITEDNKEIVSIIIAGIDDILNSGMLQLKTLKRFVKENFTGNPIKLNEHPNNASVSFLFYVLYRIGKSEADKVTDQELKNFLPDYAAISEKTVVKEAVINKEVEDKMVAEILSDKDYSAILQKGADTVLKSI